jgi:dTDP-4-amino-4,6-dideoxygalactose transaminase
MFSEVIGFIKDKFGTNDFIPLHAPVFSGNERAYLMDTIDSTFVSSVGAYVEQAEKMITEISQTRSAVAVVNGTSGLQIAMQLAGVSRGDEVLTQALTFVATANAINYIGAEPVFLDVDLDTMGLSAKAVAEYLEEFCEKRDEGTYNKVTQRKISAVVPMHTFGFPVHLDALMSICTEWNIPLVEDAAESLGSYYKGTHTGSFGQLGVFSFNGNKLLQQKSHILMNMCMINWVIIIECLI